jgi:hypothetical protein
MIKSVVYGGIVCTVYRALFCKRLGRREFKDASDKDFKCAVNRQDDMPLQANNLLHTSLCKPYYI